MIINLSKTADNDALLSKQMNSKHDFSYENQWLLDWNYGVKLRWYPSKDITTSTERRLVYSSSYT